MRYLFLFLLGLFAIWWLRRRLEGDSAAPRAHREPPPPELPEQMHECAQCGVHVPESECVNDAGVFYCSEAHRRLGPRS